MDFAAGGRIPRSTPAGYRCAPKVSGAIPLATLLNRSGSAGVRLATLSRQRQLWRCISAYRLSYSFSSDFEGLTTKKEPHNDTDLHCGRHWSMRFDSDFRCSGRRHASVRSRDRGC